MGKRVLVCDDEPLMRHVLVDCLRADGWDVVGEARDGHQAIQLYRRLRPDAVTMDVVMPGVDGLTALERILEFDPQAKIVMVSALSHPRLVAEAGRKGAHDFIAKPFLAEHLQQTLRNCEPATA